MDKDGLIKRATVKDKIMEFQKQFTEDIERFGVCYILNKSCSPRKSLTITFLTGRLPHTNRHWSRPYQSTIRDHHPRPRPFGPNGADGTIAFVGEIV